ncbi:MAG TPA: dihydrolipoyl dehydrogenase [Nitrospiraceae bacterium]|jgi:mycothione reductase|nr:dihydrolipoyl dehydrogenase [Nitrospiraceae bacterium]
MEIKEAQKFGITASVTSIDFSAIMERMRTKVRAGRDRVRKGITSTESLDFYETKAHFTGNRTLAVGKEQIKGDKIFIVTGARPFLPSIKGLDLVPYLTNESVLELTELPESLLIIGGGYIAVEFAHFFSAMGTKVTLVQRNERLVPEEEPEISESLKKALSQRMEVHTNTDVSEIRREGSVLAVSALDRGSGSEKSLTAQQVLIAAGRTSNADILQVEKSGIKTDKRGYITVNEYFETSARNIWAFGDAIGKKMFKHAANRETTLVWHNALHDKKAKLDYLTVPHAVFTWPEIASVGLTEAQAVEKFGGSNVLVGMARYDDVARGEAMMAQESFAKAIVKKGSDKILGFHLIGPQASVLIQEVVNAMANDLDLWSIGRAMHIHPALPELILSALGNLREVDS